MNANFVDIALGLSNVLTRDNQAPMTAPLRLADGSLPLPGLQFANDVNTGLRRSGTDEMRWVGGGADRMFIDAVGKMWQLGALDVAGAADFHALVTALLGVLSRSDGAALQEFLGERYQANTNGGTFRLRKSRNATIGGHTIVQNGDTLGIVRGEGSDGSAFLPGGDVTVIVDGTPGAGDMPGAILLLTTPDGTATPVERMAIRADGRVQIPNRAAPLIQLFGAGHVDLAEIAAPANPAADVARLYAFDEAGVTNLLYRRSDGTLARLRPALQAEMVAATSNEMFVSPGRQHFHPGHPKAAGRGASAGGITGAAYNVASIVRNSTGNYTVTLTTAMANADYWVVGSAVITGGARIFIWTPTNSSVFVVQIRRDDNDLIDSDFGFAVFGNM